MCAFVVRQPRLGRGIEAMDDLRKRVAVRFFVVSVERERALR